MSTAWRVQGRVTANGAARGHEFVVVVSTEAREAAQAEGLRGLLARSPDTDKAQLEIEQLDLLGPVYNESRA